jgi:hypothetical protein
MSLVLLFRNPTTSGPTTEIGSFTSDAILLSTVSGSFVGDSILLRTESATFTADSVLISSVSQAFVADALLLTSTSNTFTADAYLLVAPVWTTPILGDPIDATQTFAFMSPPSASDQHYQMEFDKVDTFDSVFYILVDSSADQSDWQYFNDTTWVALPSTGVPAAFSDNEVRVTVTLPSGGRWYRRVRAGS